jgi:hypothetical protein
VPVEAPDRGVANGGYLPFELALVRAITFGTTADGGLLACGNCVFGPV